MRTRDATLVLAATLALSAGGLAACKKKSEAEPAQVGKTAASSSIDQSQVKTPAKDEAAEAAVPKA